jgi:O-antigen ligase
VTESRPRGAVEPRDLLRLAVLVCLVAAPLAFGAVHEPASIPLLAVAYVTGLLSWARGHWARAHGEAQARVPGRRLLLALHTLVAFQLLPLPPAALRWLSPGSVAFREERSLVGLAEWSPISVSPPDTLRGLLFLGGMSLLFATVFREFDTSRWRRILGGTVVATALAITIEALLQAASPEPARIYGLWRPRWDWGVFGPYVNRNHFAGYLVMAIPLALGFTLRSLHELRASWGRRRVRWLALGERAGPATLWRASVALALLVGLLASQSRGGLMAWLASLTALPLAVRRRAATTALVLLLASAAVGWMGLAGFAQGFESRGIRASRVEFWSDALQLAPRFPLLGVGLNAFGTAYPPYQTFHKEIWWGELHNEYLQALVDTGVLGALLAAALLVRLFASALRGAARGAIEAALLGSLLASASHNLVDFNWQIPANAATFAALAGLAMRGAEPTPAEPRGKPLDASSGAE